MPIISSTSAPDLSVYTPTRAVQVRFISATESQLLLTQLDSPYRAGIIVNTIREAQGLYTQLRQTLPSDTEIILLHSSFITSHRRDIESRVMACVGKKAPQPDHNIVIIGTQILEQSLDIDFDLLISALAPIENMIQRMGRLHRHDRIRSPETTQAVFYVLEDPDPGSIIIYGEFNLLKSRYLLTQKEEVDFALIGELLTASEFLDEHLPHADWEEPYKKHQDVITLKKAKTRAYLLQLDINNPARDLFDFITTNHRQDDIDGQSAVRDGNSGLPVTVFFKSPEGDYWVPTWNNVTHEQARSTIDLRTAPYSDNMGLLHVLGAEVTLPFYLNTLTVIEELEKRTPNSLKNWLDQSWALKGVLPLILDMKGQSSLNLEKVSLQYDTRLGLLTISTPKES